MHPRTFGQLGSRGPRSGALLATAGVCGLLHLFVACSTGSSSGCSSDSDCKGGRLCKKGACTDPPIQVLPDAGAIPTASGACGSCIGARCSSSVQACNQNSVCKPFSDCVLVCADVAGYEDCALNQLAAATQGQSLMECAAAQCAKDCGAEAETCADCAAEACATETKACDSAPDCGAFATCWDACDSNACVSQCVDAHPTGAAVMAQLSKCASAGCPELCGSESGGAGGSGGTGGASSGGNPSTGGKVGGGGGSTSVAGSGAAGASSGGGGSGGSGPTYSQADLQRMVDTQCTRLSECAPGFLARAYGSLANCRARVSMGLRWDASLPGSGSKAEWMQACASVLETQSCAAYLSWSKVEPACRVFGDRPLGQPCVSASQCASGQCSATDYSCGKCVPLPASGATCTTNMDCNSYEAEYCGPGATCKPARRAGQTCTANDYCDRGLACISGTCVAQSGLNEHCDGDLGVYCNSDQSLICSADTLQCMSLGWASASEACGWVGSVYRLCNSFGQCSLTGSSGTCVAGPKAGDSCSDTEGPFCTYPDLCVAGTCVSPPVYSCK